MISAVIIGLFLLIILIIIFKEIRKEPIWFTIELIILVLTVYLCGKYYNRSPYQCLEKIVPLFAVIIGAKAKSLLS